MLEFPQGVSAPIITPRNSAFAAKTIELRLPNVLEKLQLRDKIGRAFWEQLRTMEDGMKQGAKLVPLERYPDQYRNNWQALQSRTLNWRTYSFIDLEYLFYLKILEFTNFWSRVTIKDNGSIWPTHGAHASFSLIDPFTEEKQPPKDANDIIREMHKRITTSTTSDSFILDEILEHVTISNLGDKSQLQVATTKNARTGLKWAIYEIAPTRNAITAMKADSVVHYITDNAGYELLYDLIFAHYLIHQHKCKVNFWLRNIPVFVSDATHWDYHILLDSLDNEPASPYCQAVQALKQSLTNSTLFAIRTHPDLESSKKFSDFDASVVKEWREAALLIIKGDLNYRKIVGDQLWPPTTRPTLQKSWRSTVVVLRAIKSETLVGATPPPHDPGREYRDLCSAAALRESVLDGMIGAPSSYPVMMQCFSPSRGVRA